jgi:prepilin-type N-terminal cleavage/methylation domain-containing protein
MPISSVGRANRPNRGASGVTLIELLIVMAIIGLMAGVSFPAISAGLDSIRLASAADSIAAFLNGALNRAERRQQAVALIVNPRENKLEAYSNEPGFARELKMPDGITIEAVLPAIPDQPAGEPRRLVVMPGSTAPAIGVQIVNRRGARRIVSVDPMTGFPRVESVSTK